MTRVATGSEPARSFRGLASARLHVLMRSSERFYENYYRTQFELSLRECRIIGVVGQYRQVSFKRTCDESFLDKSHVSRLVAVLIRRGILRKVSDPMDRRSVHLSLSERGRAIHDALHVAAGSLNTYWLSALTAAQRRSFEDYLGILSNQLQKMIRENVGSEKRGTRHRSPGAAAGRSAGAREDDRSEVILNGDIARQLYQVLGAALGETSERPSKKPARGKAAA